MNAVIEVGFVIQMTLMLLACYFCYRWGHREGILDTLDVLEKEGVIEKTEVEEE